MSIPPQKLFHRPVLDAVNRAEGTISLEHIRQQIEKEFVEWFSLTESDIQEKLSSGVQTRFENRTNWSVSYLKRAGLLQSPSRARYEITSQGREFLTNHPDIIENMLELVLIQRDIF